MTRTIKAESRETRTIPGTNIVVQRINIIGTDNWVYSAWVPSKSWGDYSTVTTINDRNYGRLGSERLPAELDALPHCTQERYDRVTAWHAAIWDSAYARIIEAYPDAATGRRAYGEIDLYVPGSRVCHGGKNFVGHLESSCTHNKRWQRTA